MLVKIDKTLTHLKGFLAHKNTKAEITKLSWRQSNSSLPRQVIESNCYGSQKYKSNMARMPETTTEKYSLEEGNHLGILNAFDVMNKDTCSKLDVSQFVLLKGHYSMLPRSTTLYKSNSENKLC